MILAIDCGSTFLKVGLFDEMLRLVATDKTALHYTVRTMERVEFDPERIWRDLIALIHHVCAQASRTPRDVETLAIASQAQTFTILDADGKPRMPFISWADQRAVAEGEELRRRLGADFHRHCSFSVPLPQMQLSKLLWLKRHSPEILQKGARVALLPAFFTQRLADVFATDTNLAAMNGLFSLARRDWWPEALEACGVQAEQLGGLVDIGAACESRGSCDEIGLSPRLRVVFSGNDQTAGAFGAAGRSGELVMTLGTALVAYRFAGEKPGPYRSAGCWGPYPGGGYYELAVQGEGCAALDWAISQLTPGEEKTFMRLAEQGFPGRALFFPKRMHTDAAWEGDPAPASRARAVLEGICFGARCLVEEDLGLPRGGEMIVAVGGGSQNDFWLQMLADVLNRPVRRGEGDILLGMAMMARPSASRLPRAEGSVFTPQQEEVVRYEEIIARWRTSAATIP